jgi:hypothetical protein
MQDGEMFTASVAIRTPSLSQGYLEQNASDTLQETNTQRYQHHRPFTMGIIRPKLLSSLGLGLRAPGRRIKYLNPLSAAKSMLKSTMCRMNKYLISSEPDPLFLPGLSQAVLHSQLAKSSYH